MRFVHELRRGLTIGLMTAGISSISLPSVEAATPGRMSGEAIHELVLGATVHMHTPTGSVVPVVYGEDGTLSGQTASSFIAYYLGAAKDRGRWWIKGRKLCQQWKVWFSAKPKCIAIRRQGKKFHWRDEEGKTGVATIANRPRTVVAEKSRPTKTLSKPYSLGAVETPIATLPAVREPVKRLERRTPRKKAQSSVKRRTVRRIAQSRRAVAFRTPPPLPVRPASRHAYAKTSSWTMRTN